jgi:3-phenylpropionate/trans-cinnamate dioxygenase ferredoxin reductase component
LTPERQRVLVVGGGLAAVRTAQALRELGHVGPVTMLSEELRPPYDRPPLSKTHLLAEQSPDPVELLSAEAAGELDIDLHLGCRAVGLDHDRRTVQVEGVEDLLSYDALVVATGTRARRLDVLDGIAGVHYLRTAEDATSLHGALVPERDVVIIGAGFIGLEVAAAARARGARVTLVEVAERPLAGVLGDQLATWLTDWHRDQGTTVRCGTSVVSATRLDDHVRLELSDQTTLDAGAVVVGVGVQRELEWLSTAGVSTHVGLVCDAEGRSSAPVVFGAGDIVCRHRGSTCSPVLHWTAAAESGRAAARAVLGLAPDPVPSDEYFWSHQGGLRLMSVGGRSADAALSVESGSMVSGKFVAHWSADGRIVGVVAANSARDFLRSRQLYATELEAASV